MTATSLFGSVCENRSRNSCMVPVLASGITSAKASSEPILAAAKM
jgi:hypothetical protein